MDPRRLYEQIKKGVISPIYYLYGTERFIIDELIEQLKEAILPAGMADFNHDKLYAGEHSADDVVAAAETLPMMGERRLVEVRGADKFSAKEREKFLPIVTNPMETAVVLFIAESGDQRSKLLKSVKKSGVIVQARPPYDDQLAPWMRYIVKKTGKKIDEHAVEYLLKTVGSNLQDLYNELMKAAAYVGDRPIIVIQDLQVTASPLRGNTIFDLTKAVGMKDSKEALKVLQHLLQYGEPEPRILTMLVRQWRLLWRAKSMLDEGVPQAILADRLKIHRFFRGEFFSQCRLHTPGSLQKTFPLFYEADLKLKRS